jgi:hypothetical protein
MRTLQDQTAEQAGMGASLVLTNEEKVEINSVA